MHMTEYVLFGILNNQFVAILTDLVLAQLSQSPAVQCVYAWSAIAVPLVSSVLENEYFTKYCTVATPLRCDGICNGHFIQICR